jgi:hypothetical protein
MGKTTFADALAAQAESAGVDLTSCGDVQSPDELARVVELSRSAFVVAVLQNGSSSNAVARMEQMLEARLPAIAVAVVTLRLLPRLWLVCRTVARCPHASAGDHGWVCVCEILMYERGARTPSWSTGPLATDGERHWRAGLIDRRHLEWFVPGVLDAAG